MAERFMRTMGNTLSILSKDDPRRWDDYVWALQLAYNASIHAATGTQPFVLNTGRVPRLPGEGERPELQTRNRFPERIIEIIDEACTRARDQVHRAWTRMKERFDRGRKPVDLQEGDWVCVRLSDYERSLFPSMKLAPRWSEPCRVAKALSNGVTYEVERKGGRESQHITRLLPLGHALPEEVVADKPHNDEDEDEAFLPRRTDEPEFFIDELEQDCWSPQPEVLIPDHPEVPEVIISSPSESSPYVELSPSTPRFGYIRTPDSDDRFLLVGTIPTLCEVEHRDGGFSKRGASC